MANVVALAALQKKHARNVPGQTKFTPAESADIDWAVEIFRQEGAPDATRASVIRAATLDMIQALKEEYRT